MDLNNTLPISAKLTVEEIVELRRGGKFFMTQEYVYLVTRNEIQKIALPDLLETKETFRHAAVKNILVNGKKNIRCCN